jgi:hypothetical protein
MRAARGRILGWPGSAAALLTIRTSQAARVNRGQIPAGHIPASEEPEMATADHARFRARAACHAKAPLHQGFSQTGFIRDQADAASPADRAALAQALAGAIIFRENGPAPPGSPACGPVAAAPSTRPTPPLARSCRDLPGQASVKS